MPVLENLKDELDCELLVFFFLALGGYQIDRYLMLPVIEELRLLWVFVYDKERVADDDDGNCAFEEEDEPPTPVALDIDPRESVGKDTSQRGNQRRSAEDQRQTFAEIVSWVP